VQHCEDTDGFHGNRRAGAVIGCASTTLPGVEVAAEHNDFIFFEVPGISPTTLKLI
jgi:hypothetical protein